MKGKNFLKVTGILMIIGGALSCVGYIFVLACTACAATIAFEGGVVGTAILTIIMGVLACADGIIELIAGIVGVKNCDKPEKANLCMVLGIVVLIIAVISLIGTIINSASAGTSSVASIIITIICSVAIPVLYIIGAALNKKSA